MHVSDVHIDSKMETNFDKTKAKERNHELLVSFENLFDVMEKENYDAMILSGDLFDTKKISTKSFSYVLDLMQKHQSKTFFYIPGNHDDETKLIKNYTNLPQNLIIFGNQFQAFALSNQIEIGGIALDNSNYNSYSKQINFNPNKTNIMMLHGAITKSPSGINSETIYTGDIKNKNIDYLALGHIHSFSSGKIDDRCIFVYPGCLEPRGFDEIGDKGYVKIEIIDGKINYQFVKHAKRTFHELKIDITEAKSSRDILDSIYENTKNIAFGDVLRIVLTGKYDINLVKSVDLMEKELNQKFYYAKIIDKSTLKINIDDYKNDYSLKSMLIKQVYNCDKLTDEDKDEIILTGIKALSGEDID